METISIQGSTGILKDVNTPRSKRKMTGDIRSQMSGLDPPMSPESYRERGSVQHRGTIGSIKSRQSFKGVDFQSGEHTLTSNEPSLKKRFSVIQPGPPVFAKGASVQIDAFMS